MIITFQYRLKPTPNQVSMMATWSELMRRHWNFAHAQRLDWLNRTRSRIDRCSIVSCPIGEIPERVDYYTQQSDLKQTKELFPAYKEKRALRGKLPPQTSRIYSEVQQMNIQRLDKAWKRWLIPDRTGKRGGRPKFKARGEKPSFSFSRVNHPKAACTFGDSAIKIPRIGDIAAIVHRPIPEGFVLKTATICYRADGWYVSISASDETVPEPKPLDTVKSVVGVDVGLKVFLATSEGEFVPVPQIYRKAQAHLARAQRTIARRSSKSNNQEKQKSRVAKIHQRIARQREKFHYQTAHSLCRKYDLIAVEDLNIRGLARTKMAKSIYDVAWGKFLTILESVAVKCGVHFVKVSPYNTTQDCSQCGTKVKEVCWGKLPPATLRPKTLSIRTHECHKCGLSMDRDENAAVNILLQALQAVGLTGSACGALVDGQALRQELLDVNLEAYVTAPA